MRLLVAIKVDHEPISQPRHQSGRFGSYIDAAHPVHTYKSLIRAAARTAMNGREPFDIPLAVRLLFLMPRTQSDRSAAYTWSPVVPDVDNLEKSFFDAASHIVYTNDSRIVSSHSLKVKPPIGTKPAVYAAFFAAMVVADSVADFFRACS